MLARQRDALVLDNGRVRIVAAPGGVTIEAHGRRLDDCLAFDSTTDAGDSYTPSLRGDPVPLALVRVRPRAGGPLRAAVALRWVLPAGRGPAVATDLASMTDAPAAGDARRGPVCVDAVLTLDAGAAHVGLALRVVNRRRDHRLRLLWRSGVAATRVLADAALGPVWRAVAAGDDADHGLRPLDPPAEIRLPTMPLHRWIAAFDGDRGATLVSDGLAEAEPLPHGMAVTLVRAVGELSRRDLPERPGHAGWPARIPRAQCLGTWRAAFGLLVHGGDAPATRERIEAVADDLLLPLVGETWCDYAGPVQSLAGVALEGTTLRASSVARALTADALRLRAVNVSETPADGAWRLPDDGPWESAPCRLDETPLAPWTRHGARLPLTVPSRATVTHLVRRAER
jgi:alpha-mannosidase